MPTAAMRIYNFEAPVKKHLSLNAAFVEFPYDAEKASGKKGPVTVMATLDGLEYQDSLVKTPDNPKISI